MREISSTQRHQRLKADNPWWSGGGVREDYGQLRPRAYFERFAELVEQTGVRRAVVLMGPRRVGKTVMLHHVIARLLASGNIASQDIAYASLDQPLYARLSIEEIAEEVRQASENPNGPGALFLDEIQYLADWERHLKAFVDAHPGIRCVVSGSAAAALRLKSMESGAGRFTDFLLPPLTFHEYLDLQRIEGLVEIVSDRDYRLLDLGGLNRHFVDYVNFGGFPEAVFSPAIRTDPARYIGADIVDKVLLRDLPSLYGIQDVQELNALFMTLVFNTAEEVSLDELSKRSGVTKPTIKRYLEYLEAAFLIRIVHRIDRNARRFRRITSFKVYVTTPALRCALFGPVTAEDDEMGAIAETAVFAQWFHADLNLHYARWPNGEVDIVRLDGQQSPGWCVEVKWSNRHVRNPGMLKGLRQYAMRHPRALLLATTRTVSGHVQPWDDGSTVYFVPTSLYCYVVGRKATRDPSTTAFWVPR